MDLKTIYSGLLQLSSGGRAKTFRTRQTAVQLNVWPDICWVFERHSMSEAAQSVAQTCLAVTAQTLLHCISLPC